MSQRFLFHWFQNFDLRTITEQGSTPQLNEKNLDPLLVPVPTEMDEQQEIVTVLDAIDRKIALHQQKRAVLEDLFKALVHKLMTGEIAVDELDLSALDRPPPRRNLRMKKDLIQRLHKSFEGCARQHDGVEY